MKRTAGAAELAEPSSSKKKKKKAPADAPSKSPPPEKPLPPSKAAASAAAVARQAAGKEVAYNAEKHLQEKTETYWFLAQEVKALEREHNTAGMFTAAFLNMADDKAAMLNTEIKKQTMAEAKLHVKELEINGEVAMTMLNLMP